VYSLAAITEEEIRIANLIPKERRLRARSQIVDGKRKLKLVEAEEFEKISRLINRHQRRIKEIRKKHPNLKKLDRAERDWIRLQGKENVYKVDVELDQIMTFFRVSLVNVYTFLAQTMGRSHLSLVGLLHTLLLLPGRVQETPEGRHIFLERNEKDPQTMEALLTAIPKINALGITDAMGKRVSFSMVTAI
jgi:hypothetical protein